jgi:hypothetical protein
MIPKDYQKILLLTIHSDQLFLSFKLLLCYEEKWSSYAVKKLKEPMETEDTLREERNVEAGSHIKHWRWTP